MHVGLQKQAPEELVGPTYQIQHCKSFSALIITLPNPLLTSILVFVINSDSLWEAFHCSIQTTADTNKLSHARYASL